MPPAGTWATGSIPATLGYSHTLPSAIDALYSSTGGWGWNTGGGRELGKDLYQSTGASETGEEDPNSSTWPPAMSRMNRILSVLPEAAEEEERLMSTLSRNSRLGPYSSFRMSPAPHSTAAAAVAAATAAGIPARRSSNPFSDQQHADDTSATPVHVGDPGLLPTSALPGAAGVLGQQGQQDIQGRVQHRH